MITRLIFTHKLFLRANLAADLNHLRNQGDLADSGKISLKAEKGPELDLDLNCLSLQWLYFMKKKTLPNMHRAKIERPDRSTYMLIRTQNNITGSEM